MVARSTVLTRAAAIWPTGGVPYSQSVIHQPDGYRQDCSGFVSMCWAIPPGQWGGENTESLVTEGWMIEIPIAELQPGDAVGMCGPGTLGDAGHVQLFDGWTGAVGGALTIWEQAGGTWGPTHHTIKRITPGYRAYRFRDITGSAEGNDDMSAEAEIYAYNASAICFAMATGADAADCQWAWTGDGHTIGDHFRQPLDGFWSRVGGSGGAGPSLEQIRKVVDEELDEQSLGGADKD